ncbi:hypothetical protein BDR06DRAFT_1014269 [Suillus hirtellus]|nr:hypothetical protein BDR06DRAFT_1014269 [Suillus hirtellus]
MLWEPKKNQQEHLRATQAILADRTQLHHTNSPGHQEFSPEPLQEDLSVESTAERVNSARMSSQPILGEDNFSETGPEGGIDGGNVHDSEDGNDAESDHARLQFDYIFDDDAAIDELPQMPESVDADEDILNDLYSLQSALGLDGKTIGRLRNPPQYTATINDPHVRAVVYE